MKIKNIIPTAALSAATILIAGGATSCGSARQTTKSTAGNTPTQTEKPTYPARQQTGGSRAETTISDELTAKMAGEWQIIKTGKTSVTITDDMPYINFDIKTNRFYASDGCNILNGDFMATVNNTVVFDHVLSTLRMCPEANSQEAIRKVLSDGKSFFISFESTNSEDVTIMVLRNREGKSILTLRRSDMNFLNGQWQVIKIGDQNFDNPEMNLFFDIPAQKVHGNTGCNFFNGDIYTDPTVGASLNFGQLGVTRMACPDQGIEQSLLVALEEVCSARPASNGDALLNDANGTTLLVLRPMSATNDSE